MPYCIIFFALSILYLTMFFNSSIKKIYLIFTILTATFAIFISSTQIFNGLKINFAFVVFLILLYFYILIFSKIKHFGFDTTIVIAVLSFYYFSVNNNIFLSIDYNLSFTILLSLVFLIFSFSISDMLYIYFIFILGIFVLDSAFWWQELRYVDFNVLNMFNLIAINFSICLVVNKVIQKIKLIGGKYEKNS